jgi:uncharacterized phiE125 gp8 family phage protein
MIPILIDGPAVEPVSLSEMNVYLRRDDGAEGELIAGLIKAARLMVEAASRRTLLEQRWRLALDAWPVGRIVSVPIAPVLAVDRIRIFDADGNGADLHPSLFDADTMSDPARIHVHAAAGEPGRSTRGIEIELRAGFGATPDAVPASLRLAVKIMVARWFENRGDVAGVQDLPPEALALVAPFRRARL